MQPFFHLSVIPLSLPVLIIAQQQLMSTKLSMNHTMSHDHQTDEPASIKLQNRFQLIKQRDFSSDFDGEKTGSRPIQANVGPWQQLHQIRKILGNLIQWNYRSGSNE